MSIPGPARSRSSKYFLTYGHVATPRVEDDNSEENPAILSDAARYQPVCRFGPPLMMMWKDVARVLDAGDSYQQDTPGQGPGAVASYSWSSDGRTSGGSGATATYEWSSTGLKTVTCTVTDSNGYSSTGTRWVRVVDVPGASLPLPDGAAPIERFEWGPFTESIPERGWGGARMAVTLYGSAPAALFVPGLMVAVYEEFYEDGAQTSASEVFSGFVLTSEVLVDPVAPRVVVQLGSIEALLGRDGMDSDYAVFFDAGIIESFGTTDPLTGTPVLPDTGLSVDQPWHKVYYLTVGKIAYHLLRYHLLLEVNGSTHGASQVVDLIRDWWNDGIVAQLRVYAFGLQRGNLMQQLAQWLPGQVWCGYSTRLSQLVITKHHVAKTTPDDSIGAIDTDLAETPIRPIDGPDSPVRQVILFRSPQSLRNLEADNFINTLIKYPDPANASGSLVQPQLPFWFTHVDVGNELAKGVYDYESSTKGVQIALAGRALGLFNIFTLTLSAGRFSWSNKRFWVTRIDHERDAAFLGGHRQVVLGREVLIS